MVPEGILDEKGTMTGFDNDLDIRTSPGVDYEKTGKYTGTGIFTIVREMDGWGKLKSGAGWICLKYTERV